MMEKQLPNQEEFMELFNLEMQQGETLFFISGISGSGKSFSTQTISDSFKQASVLPIYLNGDRILLSEEYLPFKNALSETLPCNAEYGVRQMLSDFEGNLPSTGKKITGLLKIFANRNEAQIRIRDMALNEKEQDIVCKIQYLAEHRETIFICDHLNYWDEKSVKLLYMMLKNIKTKYSFLSKSIFLIIHTSNKDDVHKDLIDAIRQLPDIKEIDFPNIKYEDFNTALNSLGYTGDLPKQESQILFSLVNGHILLLKEFIKELNGNRLSLNGLDGKAKELLTKILQNRLEDCGAKGEQIKITLEYASLLGVTFSTYELNRIMEIDSSVFKKIIDHSNEMKLIEQSNHANDTLQFAHDIIREIFEGEITEGNDYYEKIELCFKEIQPGQYLRRSQYAFKATDFNKSVILFVLDIIRQIREDGDISAFYMEKCEQLLRDVPDNDLYYNFVMCIRDAYMTYRKGNYTGTLTALLSLDDIYPKELLAEREILCSYCYTKKLDTSYRTNGLESLKYYAQIENCNNERDIYERILIRLMILYVHLGDKENAVITEKKVVDSLRERMSHDETAKSRFYTLNRIATAIYGCEIALNKMKRAVAYFALNYKDGGLWRDIKQFYLCQVNYAGALCLNGEFNESYQKNMEVLALYQQFPDYPFPRPSILLNNYLVSAYLSGNLRIEEGIAAYKDFIAELPLCAERLFYTSNLSIFLALSNDLDGALRCIEKEAKLQNVENDKEKIYNYRVTFNTSIYNFLAGNKNEAIQILGALKEQMNQYTLKGDDQYDYSRVNKALDLIQASPVVLPNEWENILLENSNAFQTTAWNYYGKGFVFTTVFNWDL